MGGSRHGAHDQGPEERSWNDTRKFEVIVRGEVIPVHENIMDGLPERVTATSGGGGGGNGKRATK